MRVMYKWLIFVRIDATTVNLGRARDNVRVREHHVLVI